MPAREPGQGSGYLARPAPSGLADVLEVVLDRGIVVDAYVRVSLLGIELITVDARIVVSSVDTYLRFAEATNRLDLWDKGGESPIDLLAESVEKTTKAVASAVVEHKIEGAVDSVGEVVANAEDAVEDSVDKVAGAAQQVFKKVAGR